MEKMKYINSEYRVIIGQDKVYNGVNDTYSWIEIHFSEEELDCGNESFVLAFGKTMIAGIKRSRKNTVDAYNEKTCIKDKYLKFYLAEGTDIEATEEMLIRACNRIEGIPFDKTKEGKIYELIFRYEDDIKECAAAIRNAIFTEVDYNRENQIVVLPVIKRKDKRNNENN